MATDYLPGNRYITNNELSFFKSLPASEKMFYYKKLKEIHPEILSNRQEDVLAELWDGINKCPVEKKEQLYQECKKIGYYYNNFPSTEQEAVLNEFGPYTADTRSEFFVETRPSFTSSLNTFREERFTSSETPAGSSTGQISDSVASNSDMRSEIAPLESSNCLDNEPNASTEFYQFSALEVLDDYPLILRYETFIDFILWLVKEFF